jgi:serine/threonine-protein kinase
VVPVYDMHIDDCGRVFFTMPLIEGLDLREVFVRVQRGDPAWSMTRAVDVLLSVCEIVSYAHSRGVMHRDLTPGNIRVGTFGEVYVLDWGLAKAVGREDRSTVRRQLDALARAGVADWGVTVAGTVIGTPSFMPPEQAEGRLDELGFAADVYALGASLYCLLAGRPPYTDPKRTTSP